jgi:hypothetical protein
MLHKTIVWPRSHKGLANLGEQAGSVSALQPRRRIDAILIRNCLTGMRGSFATAPNL